MKGFWQHIDGKVYAVRSDTFGHITGVAGPVDLRRLRDLNDYQYEPGMTGWISRAIARHDLHPVSPENRHP